MNTTILISLLLMLPFLVQAESHFGAAMANEQFSAVTKAAFEFASDLYRVKAIKTLQDVGACSTYKVTYSNKSEQTGKISKSHVQFYKVQTLADKTGAVSPGQNIKVEEMKSLQDCK